MPTFGELLKQDRERMKLSQEQLAKMLDVSQQAVANWEAGTSHPRRDRRARLLQILGPDSALVKTPPRHEFVPAGPTPSPEDAASKFESARSRVEAAMARYEADREEFRSALPERLQQYIERDIGIGAATRRLDYLSQRLGVEIKRLPANRFFTWQNFAPAMLHLAVVRGITQATEPRREYLLIVVNDLGVDIRPQSMQRVMFDAGVLGITIQQVPSMTAAGHLIDQIESEPDMNDESTAKVDMRFDHTGWPVDEN
jgi:transcriptional regulator with XRE-family HTH domain